MYDEQAAAPEATSAARHGGLRSAGSLGRRESAFVHEHLARLLTVLCVLTLRVMASGGGSLRGPWYYKSSQVKLFFVKLTEML